MKILVLGGGGMLGHKLVQVLRERFEVWATVRSSFAGVEHFNIFDREKTIEHVTVDNFDSVVNAFGVARPDVVVNCIGVVKQLKAAQDPIVTLSVNSIFPHRAANLCRAANARFITLSTDCVFSGKTGDYSETDLADAVDLYGRSKHLGEVVEQNCLTLRTSIIGRELNTAHSLIEWFLSNQNKRVKGFRRAIYSGLTTLELSEIIMQIIDEKRDLSGMWHVASQPISKFELLELVRDCIRLDIEIEPDDEFLCDRSLNGSRFAAHVGIPVSSWNNMIEKMANDPTPYNKWRAGNAI